MTQHLEERANVVGGTTERDHLFPWVVDVAGTLTGKGVLISPLWVLTAAHNVATSFAGARVAYRRTDPSGRATGSSQNTGTGSVKVHPRYVGGQPDFDIALVRLPGPFAADPFLQPAALPTAAAAVGQQAVVASISHSGPLPAGNVAVWRGPVILTGSTTFIARSPTASLCPGDSGSGVITTAGGVNVVTGIAAQSQVGDCKTPNIEFAAVDVFKHLEWIRTTIGLFNAEFHTTNGAGGLTQLRGHSNWRTTWDLIVPGDFGGDGRTDLLFYDRRAGYGEFHTTDGTGGMTLLRSQGGWRTTWDIIVPGHFGGSGRTDLLFYDRETGTIQFYATEGGAIHQLRTHTNVRTTWDAIIPGDFGGDGNTDLLFYDRSAGYGEFYTTDGVGGMRLLRSHANWRRTWDLIVPGQFGGDGRTDLLFYDRAAGQGEFHKTDGRGGISQLRLYGGWRGTWSVILSGNFAEGSGSDLLFYDRAAGWGEFYRNLGEARLTQTRAFDNWRKTWTQIVVGDFGGNGWADLLFYERPG